MKSPFDVVADVIVVGAGVTGLTMALALAKKTQLQIRLLESTSELSVWNPDQYDLRVSAISLASQRIFQRLGVWEHILKKRASVYKKMLVWDESSKAKLEFDCAALFTKQLGWIIEDTAVRESLLEEVKNQKNITIETDVQLTALDRVTDGIVLKSDTCHWKTSLVIAADGGHSWVREVAGIPSQEKSYEQKAIVAMVETEQPHQDTAYQRFLKTGPLAFLPLQKQNQSSIVWSVNNELATELLALDETDFRKRLAENFTHHLGDVIQVSSRKAFPLVKRSANHYVQDHLALIGDAAHTIHPLAGQGVNLGLLDVACLLDVITQAHRKQRNFASLATLRMYERARKTENADMLTFVDGIQQMFTPQNGTVNFIKETGVNLTNQISFIKNFFTSHAVGNHQLTTLAKP